MSPLFRWLCPSRVGPWSHLHKSSMWTHGTLLYILSSNLANQMHLFPSLGEDVNRWKKGWKLPSQCFQKHGCLIILRVRRGREEFSLRKIGGEKRISIKWTSAMCQILERTIWINYFIFKQVCKGLPWWSSGQDSIFPMQGAQVPSLGRKLDPPCLKSEFTCHN